MRGFLSPAVQALSSEHQKSFRTLSRARRSKVAKAAQTTLLKADQWAAGKPIAQELAEAIERALAGVKKKK